MGISPDHSKSKQKDIFLPKEGHSFEMRKALIMGKSVCSQVKRKVDQFLEVGEQTSYKLYSDGASNRKVFNLAGVPYSHQQGNIAESSKKRDSMENVICVTNKDPYSELPFLFRTDESKNNSSYSRQENNNGEDLSFIDGNIQRAVIPVGPKFQAEVPEWSGGVDVKNASHVKYLGTVIWPIEGEKLEVSSEETGKGRPDSCSCAARGSVNCVKLHIVEAKDILKSQLGPAFYSWKFDEIGKKVPKEDTQT